jgi:hypothetical protein
MCLAEHGRELLFTKDFPKDVQAGIRELLFTKDFPKDVQAGITFDTWERSKSRVGSDCDTAYTLKGGNLGETI